MKRFIEGEDRSQGTLFPERLDDCQTVFQKKGGGPGGGPPPRMAFTHRENYAQSVCGAFPGAHQVCSGRRSWSLGKSETGGRGGINAFMGAVHSGVQSPPLIYGFHRDVDQIWVPGGATR